jgi:hypothetical protein
MHVWGRTKEHNAGQSDGHMPAWVANNTHVCSKGTRQAPHGDNQADHSLASESEGIQMHVWGRTKQTMQVSQNGHMPASVANNTHVDSKGTQQAPHGGKQADHSLAADSGGIQMCGVGRKNTMQAIQRGTYQHSRPASQI